MTARPSLTGSADSASPFLTLGEVIQYLRVNARTAYRLIGSGELPASRIGRQWRIRRSDLERFIESQRVGSPASVTAENTETDELWVGGQIQEVLSGS